MAPLSQLAALPYIANIIGTIFVAAGINAILRPTDALTYFEYHTPPTGAKDRQMVDSLLAIYGVRDIFMGFSIYAATLTGTKKSLGWTLVFASAVAFADGVITKSANGTGEWGHWSYAPVLTVVGSFLVGLFD